MNEIQFDRRIKLIAKVLFAINILDLFFYDSSKPLWSNALNLGFAIAFGALIAWGVHSRKNWARILVYFSFVLGMLSALSWPQFSTWQKGAFLAGSLPFLVLIYFFHRYPALTSQYFLAGSMRKKWKIAVIAVGSLIVLLFGAATIAGLYFRHKGSDLAAEMKASLVLEGTVDPKVFDTCKEKFGRKIEDAEILGKFCHCFGLNMDKVTGESSSDFVTRSVALTMACWPIEAPALKGLSD